MSTNSQQIVEQLVNEFRAEMESLLAFLQNPSAEEAPTVYEMEGGLLKRLLALGRQGMALYLASQALCHQAEVATNAQGRVLPYFGQKRRSFLCLFGKVEFCRSYYWDGNAAGWFPLDAALNLPKTSVSDRLREWREALGVAMAYHPVGAILRDMIGVPGSSRSVQTEIQEEAALVEAYYAQAQPPASPPDATLLVVEADGKGVPLVKPSASEPKVRLGKGEKSGRKKEAIVTTVYTQAPRARTPEEVVSRLFDPQAQRSESPQAAEPVDRWTYATLEGKAKALGLAVQQAARREGAHIKHRIALTDGSQALQERTQEALGNYTLVLDIIHAIEYLWKAGNVLLGETAPTRTAWVRDKARQLLCGQTAAVIAQLRTLAQAPERTALQRQTLEQVAGYYERNQACMAYDRYLALGWPIATGVIEGACRHLVKDRCEQSGMRWTQVGAEALLRLRSVAQNGDWEPFHAYRRAQRHRTLYGVGASSGLPLEALTAQPLASPSLLLAA